MIEDKVWLGSKSLILVAVRLGKRPLVAGLSVIIESSDPNKLIAGVPGKKIRDLV